MTLATAIKPSAKGANRSYDGPRLAQNVGASSYGVGVGLRISFMYLATWLCMESKR